MVNLLPVGLIPVSGKSPRTNRVGKGYISQAAGGLNVRVARLETGHNPRGRHCRSQRW